MVIEPRLTSRNEIEKIKLGKHTIEEINNAKLLGIIFDNKLTMHDHIKHICKKASDKLYALARISQYLNLITAPLYGCIVNANQIIS